MSKMEYWLKGDKQKDFSEACYCVGPQNGDPACPCNMGKLKLLEKEIEKKAKELIKGNK